MRISQYALLAPVLCFAVLGQTTTVDVGSGAPTIDIQQAYLRAYFRNNFANLVSLPPLANVKTLGTTGLVQEFADAAKSQTNKYALIKANASAPVTETGGDVLQVYGGMYSYYTSIGPTTVGYPVIDTQNCPNLVSSPGNTCLFQLFDKPYALFVYKTALSNGTANFATRDPFYTKWQSLGGIGGAGPATSAEQTITAASGIAATLQTYDQGAIFNITSGTLMGRLVGVGPAVYAAYSNAGGYAGFLGLPVADEMLQPDGTKRQIFEGGFVNYTPGSPAVAKRGIHDIVISPSVTALKLNLGDSLTLTATPYDAIGNALTDRPLVWSTSNGRVITVLPNGQMVTIKAVGGGSATVTASSEGKASTPVSVVVSAPCCGLGEGAPTPAIQQAFQDAATRNRLAIQLPAPGPVQRLGNGYVQNLQDAATGAPYLIAIADRSSTAYVLSGPLLAKYVDLGGPSGALGYPVSDATPGGRQMFENHVALAGNPAQSVSGSFLTKWASLNYETGSAGSPTSAVSNVLSFQATEGSLQSFRGGVLVSIQTGPTAGQVFFVSGPVLAAYTQAGGTAGTLGLPIDDEAASGAKRRQDFEGGYIDYSPGDAAGLAHPGDRHPLITATPSQALIGGRIRLAIGGFDPGSTVRVSIAGQPDFTVKTDAGAYVWDAVIPANARTGVIAIHAVDIAKPSASADGSYTVRSTAQVVFQVTKISGDGQSGVPGSALPQPLRILVKDDAGNPVPDLPVSFAVSPGAQLVSAATATDSNGMADAVLRLPPSDGIALATASAGRQVVTFSAQAVHSSLLNFPQVNQVAGAGTTLASMLASSAAILRYYQNRGDLPNANGFADPVLLNQFLKSFCVSDSQGAQICDGFISPPGSQAQLVNLWRLASFAGGGLDVMIVKNDVATLRDLLGQGPVLLALAGSHFAVATGVAADGSILVMNPDPAFTAVVRDDTLAGVVRLIPRTPAARGFLVTGNAVINIISPAGSCGATGLQPVQQFYMYFCEGAQDLYELDIAGNQPFRLTLTDLGNPGNRVDLSGVGPAAYTISRGGTGTVTQTGTQWTAAPANLSFTFAGIVNAASFTPDLAPGGLFTVFGSGLAQADRGTTIEIAGLTAPVVAQSPFQISAQIPPDLAAGAYSIRISSPYGALEQPLSIQPVAPEIFRVSGQASAQAGAILNQNGTLNTPANPAPRGQAIIIYATGLGAVMNQGSLKVTQAPVTVVLQGGDLKPFFAGLAPGFIGLYQVNVIVPPATPPGLRLSVYLRQNDVTGNPVEVAIQ